MNRRNFLQLATLAVALLSATSCRRASTREEAEVSNFKSLQECIDVQAAKGGGVCVIRDGWHGTTSDIASSIPQENVIIKDKRDGHDDWWKVRRPPSR